MPPPTNFPSANMLCFGTSLIKKVFPTVFNQDGPWVIIDIIGSTNCRIMDSKGNVKTVHFNQLNKFRIPYNGLGYYVDHLVSDRVMPESTKVDPDEIKTDCVPATKNDVQNVNDPIMEGPYLEINKANVLPGRTRSSLR